MLMSTGYNRWVCGRLASSRLGERNKMSRILLAYMKDTNGATSIEYAVIAALVSIVILGALLEIGPMVESQFEQVNTGFDQAQ